MPCHPRAVPPDSCSAELPASLHLPRALAQAHGHAALTALLSWVPGQAAAFPVSESEKLPLG